MLIQSKYSPRGLEVDPVLYCLLAHHDLLESQTDSDSIDKLYLTSTYLKGTRITSAHHSQLYNLGLSGPSGKEQSAFYTLDDEQNNICLSIDDVHACDLLAFHTVEVIQESSYLYGLLRATAVYFSIDSISDLCVAAYNKVFPSKKSKKKSKGLLAGFLETSSSNEHLFGDKQAMIKKRILSMLPIDKIIKSQDLSIKDVNNEIKKIIKHQKGKRELSDESVLSYLNKQSFPDWGSIQKDLVSRGCDVKFYYDKLVAMQNKLESPSENYDPDNMGRRHKGGRNKARNRGRRDEHERQQHDDYEDEKFDRNFRGDYGHGNYESGIPTISEPTPNLQTDVYKSACSQTVNLVRNHVVTSLVLKEDTSNPERKIGSFVFGHISFCASDDRHFKKMKRVVSLERHVCSQIISDITADRKVVFQRFAVGRHDSPGNETLCPVISCYFRMLCLASTTPHRLLQKMEGVEEVDQDILYDYGWHREITSDPDGNVYREDCAHDVCDFFPYYVETDDIIEHMSALYYLLRFIYGDDLNLLLGDHEIYTIPEQGLHPHRPSLDYIVSLPGCTSFQKALKYLKGTVTEKMLTFDNGPLFGIGSWETLVPHFQLSTKTEYYAHLYCIPGTRVRDANLRGHKIELLKFNSPVRTDEFDCSCTKHSVFQIYYSHVNTKAGDCGFPVCIELPSKKVVVIGLHLWGNDPTEQRGNSAFGFGANVDRHDKIIFTDIIPNNLQSGDTVPGYQFLLKKDNSYMQASTADIFIGTAHDPVLIGPENGPVGWTKRNVSKDFRLCRDERILNSLLMSDIPEIADAAHIDRHYKFAVPDESFYWRIAQSYYESESKVADLDPLIVKCVYDHVERELSPYIEDFDFTTSLKETLAMYPSSTSLGHQYYVYASDGTKYSTKSVFVDPEKIARNLKDDELATAYTPEYYAYILGEVTTNPIWKMVDDFYLNGRQALIYACPKAEQLNYSKNTRIFFPCPLPFDLVYRTYTQILDRALQHAPLMDCGYFLGYSPFDGNFDKLFQHLLSVGNNIWCGDASNSDANLGPTLMRLDYNFRKRFIPRKDLWLFTLSHDALVDCLFVSFSGQVDEVHSGQKSGSGSTLPTNTLIYRLAFYYVAFLCLQDADPFRILDYNSLTVVPFGDDILYSVSDELAHYINPPAVMEKFHQVFGVILKGTEHFNHISELEFLSTEFVRMKPTGIHSMLNLDNVITLVPKTTIEHAIASLTLIRRDSPGKETEEERWTRMHNVLSIFAFAGASSNVGSNKDLIDFMPFLKACYPICNRLIGDIRPLRPIEYYMSRMFYNANSLERGTKQHPVMIETPAAHAAFTLIDFTEVSTTLQSGAPKKSAPTRRRRRPRRRNIDTAAIASVANFPAKKTVPSKPKPKPKRVLQLKENKESKAHEALDKYNETGLPNPIRAAYGAVGGDYDRTEAWLLHKSEKEAQRQVRQQAESDKRVKGFVSQVTSLGKSFRDISKPHGLKQVSKELDKMTKGRGSRVENMISAEVVDEKNLEKVSKAIIDSNFRPISYPGSTASQYDSTDLYDQSVPTIRVLLEQHNQRLDFGFVSGSPTMTLNGICIFSTANNGIFLASTGASAITWTGYDFTGLTALLTMCTIGRNQGSSLVLYGDSSTAVYDYLAQRMDNQTASTFGTAYATFANAFTIPDVHSGIVNPSNFEDNGYCLTVPPIETLFGDIATASGGTAAVFLGIISDTSSALDLYTDTENAEQCIVDTEGVRILDDQEMSVAKVGSDYVRPISVPLIATNKLKVLTKKLTDEEISKRKTSTMFDNSRSESEISKSSSKSVRTILKEELGELPEVTNVSKSAYLSPHRNSMPDFYTFKAEDYTDPPYDIITSRDTGEHSEFLTVCESATCLVLLSEDSQAPDGYSTIAVTQEEALKFLDLYDQPMEDVPSRDLSRLASTIKTGKDCKEDIITCLRECRTIQHTCHGKSTTRFPISGSIHSLMRKTVLESDILYYHIGEFAQPEGRDYVDVPIAPFAVGPCHLHIPSLIHSTLRQAVCDRMVRAYAEHFEEKFSALKRPPLGPRPIQTYKFQDSLGGVFDALGDMGSSLFETASDVLQPLLSQLDPFVKETAPIWEELSDEGLSLKSLVKSVSRLA
jgi:hypothetical protein